MEELPLKESVNPQHRRIRAIVPYRRAAPGLMQGFYRSEAGNKRVQETRHAPRMGAIQHAVRPVGKSRRLRLLDHPLSRMMTILLVAPAFAGHDSHALLTFYPPAVANSAARII